MEAANIQEYWVLLSGGSLRLGRNMSRKDSRFYKKGNQIAGSLLAGWEQHESDPEGPLYIPQHRGRFVLCVELLAAWPHSYQLQGPAGGGAASGKGALVPGVSKYKGPGGQEGSRDPQKRAVSTPALNPAACPEA